MTSRKRLGKIVLSLVAAAALGAGGYALAATGTVQLTATGPQPPVATVGWGDTVNFQNADTAPLTIVSGQTDFNSPAIPPGGSYQKVFDGKVGKYPYRATKAKEKGGTTAIHGSVVVTMTAKLTLSAKPTTAVYGKAVALRGTTTLLDHSITLQQKTTSEAQKGWTDVGQVSPGPDGSFSFAARPVEKTAYRTTQADGQADSASVTVKVTPALTMRVPTRNARAGTEITATAHVVPASASTAVYLLASSGGHGWKQVGKAKVQANGSAKITFHVPTGQVVLRAVIKPPALHAGFEAAQSADVRLSGANAPATLEFQVYSSTAKGKHSTAPDRFSTRALRTKPGKVTLIMKNLGRARHGLAISGPGTLLKGPIVGHGGVSKVIATLKVGTYIFYSYVGADQKRGEVGRLIVLP